MFPVVGSGTTRRNLDQDMYIGGGKLFVPREPDLDPNACCAELGSQLG